MLLSWVSRAAALLVSDTKLLSPSCLSPEVRQAAGRNTSVLKISEIGDKELHVFVVYMGNGWIMGRSLKVLTFCFALNCFKLLTTMKAGYTKLLIFS